jgi:hypothetical protein
LRRKKSLIFFILTEFGFPAPAAFVLCPGVIAMMAAGSFGFLAAVFFQLLLTGDTFLWFEWFNEGFVNGFGFTVGVHYPFSF